MPTDGAYVDHEGRLVAICQCGREFHGGDRAALTQLLEHQREGCQG